MSPFLRYIIGGFVFGICMMAVVDGVPWRGVLLAIAYFAAIIGANAWRDEFGGDAK